jgi:hypothetical protein
MAEMPSQDSGDDSSCFHYDSLVGQPPNTTRVLTIHPGKSDLIECTLAIACLDTEPTFKALSYMWGTEAPIGTILINGKIFKVHPNLFDFLLRFQKSCQQSTRIWIDAIGVNQEDIPERSSQVRLMSTIYSRAELVIAWLGIEEPPGPLESLTRNPHFLDQLMHAEKSRKKLESTGDSSNRVEAVQYQRESILALDIAMTDLVGRPYWDRAWIVREVFQAHDIQAWFGAHGSQPLNALGSWLTVYSTRMDSDELEDLGAKLAISSFSAVYILKCQVSVSLHQLLWDVRHTQCADPRDRVYAFLDVTGKIELAEMEADYGKSLEQLCEDIERRAPECAWLMRFRLLGWVKDPVFERGDL